ncbi:esterase FE4 [Manduca sexta]|uniref:esterase FE4 n=1 Tax=Manduca sexta TaxID=7130 RepID=UPI00188DE032|nr:esterase FE4 [Manduca sexta]
MAQVTVTEGVLEGELVQNEYGGSFYSFKGIPFAEPPVGRLRFKAPQPPKPWQGVRSAKKFGSICCQILMGSPPPVGSEDCLYLNVYTPDIKPKKLLPVMFWVHGGAFVSGSSNAYGPRFLVRKDVIVVTINYRLEVLGFLCLDTEDIPGNAGMKDQVAALRWVNKNIKNFGGDPKNITIFGVSAGGASVGWHLVSPMTKGLFKRAIMQSGAPTCPWALTVEPRELALAFARKLGCYSKDDKELHEFFLSQPLESLIATQMHLTLFEQAKNLFEPVFVIVDEKKFGDNERFFYGDVYSSVANGVHEGVDVITGYTEDEGLLGVALGLPLADKLELFNRFHEYPVPRPIVTNKPVGELIKAGKMIKEFYFKDKINVEDWEQLVKYYSVELFVYGIIQFAKLYSNAKKNKVYLYKFTCKSERNALAHVMLGMSALLKDKKVVSHGDDVGYLFEVEFVRNKVELGSETFELIDKVTTMWTNFAKYGNPTPDDSFGVTWTPYSLKHQDYLEIGNKIVSRVEPDKEQIEFWENLYKKFCPGFVHSSHNPNTKCSIF